MTFQQIKSHVALLTFYTGLLCLYLFVQREAQAQTASVIYPTEDVNILSWWDPTFHKNLMIQLEAQCDANLAIDQYRNDAEFMRRVESNRGFYDIIIMPDYALDAVGRLIRSQHAPDLRKYQERYHEGMQALHDHIIRAPNALLFNYSPMVLLWNPDNLDIEADESISSIFNKAQNQVVLLNHNPVELHDLLNSIIANNETLLNHLINHDAKIRLYIGNHINNLYRHDDFAFGFVWAGQATRVMKKNNNDYQYTLHPSLAMPSIDIMAVLNSDKQTDCVTRALLSDEVQKSLHQHYYVYSVFLEDDYVEDKHLQRIHTQMLAELDEHLWLKQRVSTSEFWRVHYQWEKLRSSYTSSDYIH